MCNLIEMMEDLPLKVRKHYAKRKKKCLLT